MRPNTNFPIKRLEIIKCALDLFLEQGYEQTKISHILKATNLSKGGMYHYFESKEAILDGVIEFALTEELKDFDAKLMAAPTVFAKLALYLDNSSLNYSEYLQKFTQFKRHPESSIVTYRIKDISASFGIPYLQKILEWGIADNVFQTDYPEELAFVLYQAGEHLFYSVADLKQADSSTKKQQIVRKIAAFNQLLTCTLTISDNHSHQCQQLLTNILLPTQEPGGHE